MGNNVARFTVVILVHYRGRRQVADVLYGRMRVAEVIGDVNRLRLPTTTTCLHILCI